MSWSPETSRSTGSTVSVATAGSSTVSSPGAERDYLILEYASNDKLYVPSEQVGMVAKYLGGDAPRLHRLGGSDWARATAKVKRAVKDMAGELVRLYSARMAVPGHAFGPDTPWQLELEDAFPYEETRDQVTAIDEVKADMQQPIPMDRLICGDVGFGKTEIAVRAAFKAVMDGKQVAVLVPTTLLAEQHFVTFGERFAPYPGEGGDALPLPVAGAAEGRRRGRGRRPGGRGDRHAPAARRRRLVPGPRVAGRRRGAAVRRGAQGTAEAIPGARRRPHDDARRRSHGRSRWRSPASGRCPRSTRRPRIGNRCSPTSAATTRGSRSAPSVESSCAKVRCSGSTTASRRSTGRPPGCNEQLPEARIVMAHGQMDEDTLERQMVRFWDRDADVLVCTTIIESGLDVPNANTLIVDRADKLGLAQLYQLRGRVGRSGERAFAYFFFPPVRELTEEAHERLATISRHQALGSGFRIALRDLEIRGAGNLLGAEQHGHIAAVGFDAYCRILQQSVAELQGEPIAEEKELRIDLPVRAFVPPGWVAQESLRLELYRRISLAADHDALERIREETSTGTARSRRRWRPCSRSRPCG